MIEMWLIQNMQIKEKKNIYKKIQILSYTNHARQKILRRCRLY